MQGLCSMYLYPTGLSQSVRMHTLSSIMEYYWYCNICDSTISGPVDCSSPEAAYYVYYFQSSCVYDYYTIMQMAVLKLTIRMLSNVCSYFLLVIILQHICGMYRITGTKIVSMQGQLIIIIVCALIYYNNNVSYTHQEQRKLRNSCHMPLIKI